ncbi:uncharacterized protein LOC133417765 isoform X4 [Phycodurus eques]|uniref:uncharacterized protein LOC133417765 isoform X4 n=1 Tax=Phycodurus eques TaxID=693459 RepID=UPI002ACDEB3B|nr:uncharacterized protein LOC133417765 isoform X4 [Phycodurus eques]
MSRTDEVHRITENVYKSIMEQFNPCLRNFVAMGKSYEKALTSVTSAAKGYFDALLRMGEAAGGSRGAEELAEVVPQRAADGAGEESADGRSLPQRGAQEVPDGAQEQRRESGEVSERAEEAPTQKSERQNARQARRAANADGGHDGARRQNPARTSAAGGAQKQRRPAEVDGSRRRGRRRRRALPTAARVQSGGRAPGRGVVLQHVARTQGGARQEQDLAGVARHPAPLQLDGGGPGEERARRRQRAGAGALLARGRRQRHAAELQARRPGDAAGARGQRRLALRRERGDAHARLVSLLVHTRHRGGRRRLRRATSAAHRHIRVTPCFSRVVVSDITPPAFSFAASIPGRAAARETSWTETTPPPPPSPTTAAWPAPDKRTPTPSPCRRASRRQQWKNTIRPVSPAVLQKSN